MTPLDQEKPTEGSRRTVKIPLVKIKPRPLNVNQLDDETYAKLVQSMKENGQLSPILVRHIGPELLEIIDGEHRWKAANQLKWDEIEARVVDMSDEEADILNYRLNSERGNVNPINFAMKLRKGIERGLSQERIGQDYGITQARVSQYLEILTYPEGIQRMLISRLMKFTMEHARKIMSMIDDVELQAQVAKKVIEEGLSVRETEAAIKALLDEGRKEAQRGRKREEIFDALDFALRRGAFKAEECRRKGDEGYCLEWRWLKEPVELGEGLPWFKVDEVDGVWYAKASPNFCAFCEKFKREMDEDWERRRNSLNLVAEFYGSAKRDTCIQQANGPCGLLEAFIDMFKGSGEEADERWLSSISNYNCAICDKYSSVSEATSPPATP